MPSEQPWVSKSCAPDFMTDKPGMTSPAQLEEVRRVQAETKRIYSIYYSEHFAVRCVVKAGELVQAGAIGKVVNTVGLGPHRMDPTSRPGWFFERERYGGILTGIASHQVTSSSCSSPVRRMPKSQLRP